MPNASPPGHSSNMAWVILAQVCALMALSIVGVGGFSLNRVLSSQWRLGVATTMAPYVTANLDPASERALPWGASLQSGRDLTYMPMLEDQIRAMLSIGMEEVAVADEFAFRKSEVKPARIGNMCFKGSIFRNVRMTYFDAGNNVQVYNSLWYPKYEYDLPLLGIDLISLGPNRVLSVVDFQPLHATEEYSNKYIDQLKPIRDKYPSLQGTLSGKIYDDTSFFSKQMLFGRYADESAVPTDVHPAFNDYVNEYIMLAKSATPNTDPAAMDVVKERQAAYDTYSAIKDPAVGLFDAYFGKEWSANFVHDFLFKHSEKPGAGVEPTHKFSIPGQGERQ